MTTKQITPSGAVLVALDIAKARNEALIEFPTGNAGANYRSTTPAMTMIV